MQRKLPWENQLVGGVVKLRGTTPPIRIQILMLTVTHIRVCFSSKIVRFVV